MIPYHYTNNKYLNSTRILIGIAVNENGKKSAAINSPAVAFSEVSGQSSLNDSTKNDVVTIKTNHINKCHKCDYQDDNDISNFENMANHYIQKHNYEMIDIKTINKNTVMFLKSTYQQQIR